MRLQITAAVAWCLLGGVAVASAQAPATSDRSSGVYLLPQSGTEPIGSRGATVLGGVTPYTVVPADEIAQQYSVVIRLDTTADSNANFYWMDSQSAVALLTSSALVDPVVKQVLGLSPAARWLRVVVNVTSAGPRLARVEVILRKGGDNYPEEGAQKTVAALIDRLKKAYEASVAASRKAAEARTKPIADELAGASAKLEDLRRRQRDIKARAAEVSPGGMMNGNMSGQLSNLRFQRGPLQSELTRSKARLAAMLPPPPQTAQWEQTVKSRQKQLDDLQAAAKEGKATAEQVQDAESKLADAQAQLAQASQPQVADTGNQFLNSQIPQLKSSIADEEARLKDIDSQIAKINDPKLVEEVDSLPDLQSQEFAARNKISELQSRLDQVRRSTHDDTEITVTILDGSTP
jgi:hypothetical protein